ncbi:flavodoxin [Streptomyces roseirectus]|uniref:Flavodoxin n=1 Tax=Streptomyces roseirectus TaxID=2768066 RepID=A0A7H0I657_9ACTN|nr:flavodoxin domain-containing protein [Streptomyces roseirectus]QNP68273.1 flavodoxin [Streptomyces roseirectus]
MDVLVGYATAHGSTREIAERIASGIRSAGLSSEARPLETVDDADAYRAFVLGSAVHNQAWLVPARDFTFDNLDLLTARPVWLFSVGMPDALRGPWRGLGPKETPMILAALPGDLSCAEHRLFTGVVARTQFPRTGRLLFRLMGGRFRDYRDWAAVDAWASEIARELVRGPARG